MNVLVWVLLEDDIKTGIDEQEIDWEKHLCRREEGTREGGERLRIIMQV